MIILNRQKILINKFNMFGDWNNKYLYLINIGKVLPNLPLKKNKLNLIKGCQSKVWFLTSYHRKNLIFYGLSDAVIVSGLIGLIVKIYSFTNIYEILNSNTTFLNNIGLIMSLSSIRNNGLYSILNYVYSISRRYINLEL